MNKNILIVEDDEMICLLETIILEQKGYNVVSAADAQAAFDALDKEKPDLVLLDVMLPGTADGFQICEKIKTTPSTKDIPVLFLSALKDLKSIEKGCQAGADEYLTKPFKSELLVETVSSYLN